MSRWAAACLGVALAATAVSGQATGPTVDPKPRESGAEGMWSADATVARLVHEPIKILGLGRFTPEGRVALKAPMTHVESEVRAVMARLSRGEIDESDARIELAHCIAEYRVAVGKLLAGR